MYVKATRVMPKYIEAGSAAVDSATLLLALALVLQLRPKLILTGGSRGSHDL